MTSFKYCTWRSAGTSIFNDRNALLKICRKKQKSDKISWLKYTYVFYSNCCTLFWEFSYWLHYAIQKLNKIKHFDLNLFEWTMDLLVFACEFKIYTGSQKSINYLSYESAFRSSSNVIVSQSRRVTEPMNLNRFS